MGVKLPVDEESVSRICQNFYGQEVSYAMEAEEIRNRGGEWETAENISSMFARAADELSDLAEGKDPNYGLLSRLIEETAIDPGKHFPEYRQWYDKNGRPVGYRSGRIALTECFTRRLPT